MCTIEAWDERGASQDDTVEELAGRRREVGEGSLIWLKAADRHLPPHDDGKDSAASQLTSRLAMAATNATSSSGATGAM